jgi:PEP-CTERM motif
MKYIKSLLRAGILGSLPFLACVSAKAQAPLPNASAFLYVEGVSQTLPGTLTESKDGGLSSGTATFTPGLDPYLYASATAYSGLGAEASADYTYYFEVEGPSGSVPVLVLAAGQAQTTSTAYYSDATFDIQNGGTYEVNESADATANTPASFSFNQTVDMSANSVQEVDISAGVSIGFTGSGNAWVDPQISIDPTFANASEYTLVFSPNFVPEPPATRLLIFGFGLGGLFGLRRKFRRRDLPSFKQ